MLKNSLDNVHYSINGIDYLLNLNDINDTLREGKYSPFYLENIPAYEEYVNKSLTPMVGASGAVFGVMAAFALLLPNAEFMLYFAIPVKAKYLVGAYFLFEVYMAFQNQQGDNVAHLAHVGGAIVGAIMVLIWRKTDRTNFY
jgi:membrane associated rhomboid family serine protease